MNRFSVAAVLILCVFTLGCATKQRQSDAAQSMDEEPLPSYVVASLVEIDGVPVGGISQRMVLIEASSPPEYELEGTGDFAYGRLIRVTRSGGTAAWDLSLVYLNQGHAGHGVHVFRRLGESPIGEFYIRIGTGVSREHGVARVEEE